MKQKSKKRKTIHWKAGEKLLKRTRDDIIQGKAVCFCRLCAASLTSTFSTFYVTFKVGDQSEVENTVCSSFFKRGMGTNRLLVGG